MTIMTTRGWKCHTRAAPWCDIFNLASSYFHVPLTTVRHLLTVHTAAMCCNDVIDVLAGPLKRHLAWLICIVYPIGCKLCARLDGGLHGSNNVEFMHPVVQRVVNNRTPCYDAMFSCLYFTEFIRACVFRRTEGQICAVRWHFLIDDFLLKSPVCCKLIMLCRLNRRKLFPSGSSMRWMRHFYKRTDRPVETGCHDLLWNS